jgi:hypothetical protein
MRFRQTIATRYGFKAQEVNFVCWSGNGISGLEQQGTLVILRNTTCCKFVNKCRPKDLSTSRST